MKRIDVVPFNTSAKGTKGGACPSFLTRKGSMCVQQGKAVALDDKTRVAVLKLLSEPKSWTATRPVFCWAPRHALVLFDSKDQNLGWFDISLPCGKARSGDGNGALVTKDGQAFEQLTVDAWRTLTGLLEGAGVSIPDDVPKLIDAAAASPWAKDAVPGQLPPLPGPGPR